MLTKKNKNNLTTWIDKLAKFNGIIETIDGFVIGLIISALDKGVFDKINEQYHNVINEVLEHLFAEEYDQANDKLSILLADIINTPIIDGTAEEITVYNNLLKLLQSVFLNLINQMQGE